MIFKNSNLQYFFYFFQATAMDPDTALLCKQIMDRTYFSDSHIYYVKVAEILLDQHYFNLTKDNDNM